MKHWALSVTVAAIALALVACDSDGDGYDDDTGKALPANVSYSWTGTSATFFDGQSIVTRDTPSGEGFANAVIQPGDDASITANGVLPSCNVMSGQHKTGGEKSDAVYCGLPHSVLWSWK